VKEEEGREKEEDKKRVLVKDKRICVNIYYCLSARLKERKERKERKTCNPRTSGFVHLQNSTFFLYMSSPLVPINYYA
jgi:hypothetical protein